MSSTTSQTSTTISAHTDFGAANAAIPAVEPVLPIPVAVRPYADSGDCIEESELRTLEPENGENVSANLPAF